MTDEAPKDAAIKPIIDVDVLVTKDQQKDAIQLLGEIGYQHADVPKAPDRQNQAKSGREFRHL